MKCCDYYLFIAFDLSEKQNEIFFSFEKQGIVKLEYH
jgi:hypothetical protein